MASPATTRTLIAVSVAATLAVVLLVIFGVALNPTATSGALRPIPTGSPTASQLPTPAPSVIPASCDGLYTRDWAKELAPLVLNPDWTKSEEMSGTNDVALRQLLQPHVKLTCAWVNAKGGSGAGLITNVASVDEKTISMARSRIATLGWDCSEQWGGVRCVIEANDGVEGNYGESDFFKDGVWIATRWTGGGPDGYTADIVQTVWP